LVYRKIMYIQSDLYEPRGRAANVKVKGVLHLSCSRTRRSKECQALTPGANRMSCNALRKRPRGSGYTERFCQREVREGKEEALETETTLAFCVKEGGGTGSLENTRRRQMVRVTRHQLRPVCQSIPARIPNAWPIRRVQWKCWAGYCY